VSAAFWIVLLQAGATYAAIASAFVLALPQARIQRASDRLETLEQLERLSSGADKTTTEIVAIALAGTKEQIRRRRFSWRDNILGLGLLMLSVVLTGVALWIQIETTPLS